MNDYLILFDEYKSIKEMADLIEEVKELRRYYYTHQYTEMQEHIRKITYKYPIETIAWNTIHPYTPETAQQAYTSAETFLRCKGFFILIKNGERVADQLSSTEIAQIEATFMPKV